MRYLKGAVVTTLIITGAFSMGQTPVSSTFMVGAQADANQNDGDFHEQILSFSQWGTLNPYSASVSVHDEDLINGGKNLTVTSSASAAWVSAGAGTVTWRNMGWSHDTATSSGAKLNSFTNPVWSYTFTATSNSVFSLDYNVRGTGNTFGLLGAVIGWSGSGGGLNLINAYDPTAVGTFSRNVVSGTSYTISLSNWGNKFTSPIPATDSGYMDADFAWRVAAPVPEPATFLVLGCAVVMLMAAKRR